MGEEYINSRLGGRGVVEVSGKQKDVFDRTHPCLCDCLILYSADPGRAMGLSCGWTII